MKSYEKIQELKEWLAKQDALYYADKPEVTDAEYDAAVQELRNLEKEEGATSTSISNVPGFVDPRFNKVRHTPPMLSLNNAFSKDEVLEFFEKIEESKVFWCEPKIDGLSFAARFQDGKLVSASTRGDGEYGEDITNNIKEVVNFPVTLPQSIDCEVRGEVYISKSRFLILNQERQKEGASLFANPRNAAAGSLRQLDSNITKSRKLEYYIWGGYMDVTNYASGDDPKSQQELIVSFSKLGFNTTLEYAKLCETEEEVFAFYANLENARAMLEFDIDGAVYKLNDIASQHRLGATSKAPRWAIAHKFSAQEATTIIKNIILQVGKTGTLTPVAVLEPVNCGGVLITRATLHNEDEIQRKDFRIGDTVKIKRAGDVIPKIVSVILEKRPENSVNFVMPQICPACGSPSVKESGEAITRCSGELQCSAQILERLRHFVSKGAFDIEGLGENTMEEFYNDKIVSTPVDIFLLAENNTKFCIEKRPGWGEKSAKNLFESVEKAKNIPLANFLYALGIRHVGEVTAKLLASFFKSLENLTNVAVNEPEALAHINGVGEKTAKALHLFFSDVYNISIVEKLQKYLHIYYIEEKKSSGVFDGKSILFTGTLESMSRTEAEDLAEANGARIVNSVSKKLDILVCGSSPGSKLGKAQKLGVQIMTETEWMEEMKR